MLFTSVFAALALQLAAAASIPRTDLENTSATTSDIGSIFKRYPLSCDTNEYTAIADDAAAAINFLAGLGSTPCRVPSGNGAEIEFKRINRAIIIGHNVCTAEQVSSCNDVARGAGQIMDRCTYYDGVNKRVTGVNAAWGNGCLVVLIKGL